MIADAALRSPDDRADVVSGTAELVVLGHGSQIDPRSGRPVYDHADAIRERQRFADVHAAFLKQEPALAPTIRAVERDHVVVAPLLMSQGYYADQVIPSAIDEIRGTVDADVLSTEPVGTNDATAEVVLDRANEATGDAAADALVIAGHGAEGRSSSGAAVRRHADHIRDRGVYDEVTAAFLEGEPSLDGVVERLEADHVVVVPAFVASGHHSRIDVPERIGFSGDCGYVDGVEVSYADPVGTHPRMADVVLDCIREAGVRITSTVPDRAVTALLQEVDQNGGSEALDVRVTEDGYELSVDGDTVALPSRQELHRIASLNPEPVTNWFFWTKVVGHLDAHERAFLRWLEWADVLPVDERYGTLEDDGFRRRWGEVSVETTITPEGDRRYEIRHVEDQGRGLDALETHGDAEDARTLARTDENRDYRPSASARTLRTGWVFPRLDPEETIGVIDAIYPASVADWYRSTSDDLARSHVAELADGPGHLPDADRSTVERVAAACCDDAVCVRRRLWGYDASTAPDAAADEDADGAIPCASPCPHAAAVLRRAGAAGDPGELERPETGSAQLDRSLKRYARLAEGGDTS